MPTLEEQTIYALRSKVQRLEQRRAQLEQANAALQQTCAGLEQERNASADSKQQLLTEKDTRIQELLAHNTQLVKEKRAMEERVTTLLAQNKALAEEHCHLGDLLHDAQEDEYARARARQWQADMLTTLRAILVAVTRGEEG